MEGSPYQKISEKYINWNFYHGEQDKILDENLMEDKENEWGGK